MGFSCPHDLPPLDPPLEFKDDLEKRLELHRKVTITAYKTRTFSYLKSVFTDSNKESRKLNKVDHRVAQEKKFLKIKRGGKNSPVDKQSLPVLIQGASFTFKNPLDFAVAYLWSLKLGTVNVEFKNMPFMVIECVHLHCQLKQITNIQTQII